jgi:hypothetical protein
MSKQLTPEDLEKLSPQSLVEFMTENIPADKLRECLQKVDEFPDEVRGVIEQEERKETTEETQEESQLELFRNKCARYPIVITKVDKYKDSEEDYVYFYANNASTNKFQLHVSTVEKFDKNRCNPANEKLQDTDCDVIVEWAKSFKDKSTLKIVLEDYAKNNKADFITNCDEMKKLLEELGITVDSEEPIMEEEDTFNTMSNEAKLDFLKKNCVAKSGIIIGDLVKSDKSKAVVFIVQPTKDGKYTWKKFQLKLDDLNSKWCEKLETQIPGSEKYRSYQLAYDEIDSKTRSEIQTIVSDLKSIGVQIPYDFLEAGSSSFGQCYLKFAQ